MPCQSLSFEGLSQFRTLFGKFFIMYWRSPSYNATRFVMTVLTMRPVPTGQMSRDVPVQAPCRGRPFLPKRSVATLS